MCYTNNILKLKHINYIVKCVKRKFSIARKSSGLKGLKHKKSIIVWVLVPYCGYFIIKNAFNFFLIDFFDKKIF